MTRRELLTPADGDRGTKSSLVIHTHPPCPIVRQRQTRATDAGSGSFGRAETGQLSVSFAPLLYFCLRTFT